MNHKDALHLAKVSVMAAKQQVAIASDIIEDAIGKNESNGLWSTLNTVDSLLFNGHYYIINKFEEDEK